MYPRATRSRGDAHGDDEVNHGATREHLAAADLKERWIAMTGAEGPRRRQRDAARELGVSEAELVACRCGDGVRRLRGPWGDLLHDLHRLGTVMALTRNDSVVHEKVGCFGNVTIYQNTGLVMNEDIDLRIFLGHWHHGYAVTEQTAAGLRHSLQFYDVDGTAVHKVHPRDDDGSFEALVASYLHEDQSPGQAILPTAGPAPEHPDSEIDREGLRRRWEALQDVHDFHGMLQEAGAGRQQAFRLVGRDLAFRVKPHSFRTVLENAAAAGIPIMTFVASAGVIQIHTGPVSRLKETGPWYNVLDPGFSLHLRQDHVAAAWVVRKPTREGVVTSLELFDGEGRDILLMFGKRKPGEVEREDWRALVNALKPEEGFAP